MDEEYGSHGYARRAGAVLVVVLGLLVTGSVVQYFIETVIPEERRNATPVASNEGHGGGQPFKLPDKAVGSPDAKVVVTLVVDVTNSCHAPGVSILQEIGKALPERVRFEFVNIGSPEGAKKAQELGVTCQTGLAVDGKAEIEYVRDGKKQHAHFSGPLEWADPEVFYAVLQTKLKAHYGNQVTQAELDKLHAAIKAGFAASSKTGAAAPEGGCGTDGAPTPPKPTAPTPPAAPTTGA